MWNFMFVSVAAVLCHHGVKKRSRNALKNVSDWIAYVMFMYSSA